MKKMIKKRKLPRTVKAVKYQTGKTVKRKDVKRSALKPGKRLSKSGKTYYETRKNRSDKDKRKRL